jgi:D-sedoheptulose 7-phosphate isomerase
MKDLIRNRIIENIAAEERLLESEAAKIAEAAKAVISSLKKGGCLFVFGNGGSAADSQHIVAELVGRFKKERRPIAAVALTTNSSTMSALANDYGYEVTFSRQLEALAGKGDIALAISTSGNSRNVIAAVKKARSLGVKTIGLTGGDGGVLKREADISIVAPSKETPRIQESHILIGHIICELIENQMSRR